MEIREGLKPPTVPAEVFISDPTAAIFLKKVVPNADFRTPLASAASR